MSENVFIKEKRKIPNIVVTLIVAIICALIGSSFTYVLLENKIENISKGEENNSTSTQGTTNIKIEGAEELGSSIAQKATPSIVGVKVKYVTQSIFGNLQEAAEEGSGIIYNTDGYIITNYHVIESAIKDSTAKVYITLANSEEEIEAEIVGGDKVTDLAVVKINKAGLTAAEFGESGKLSVGDRAFAIGNPLGQELAGSFTGGYISALNRKISTDGRTYNLIQTDAAINPGNSGGALVNSKGQVVGINTVKIASTETEGLGFAIPVDDALPIIKELIANGKIVRPYIGISGADLDERTASRNNLVKGILITQVVSNSPAAQAGLQRGDVIVAVDGKELLTMDELNEFKNTKNIGDKIKVKVYRSQKYVEVEITLGSDDTNQTTIQQ